MKNCLKNLWKWYEQNRFDEFMLAAMVGALCLTSVIWMLIAQWIHSIGIAVQVCVLVFAVKYILAKFCLYMDAADTERRNKEFEEEMNSFAESLEKTEE